MVITSLLFSLTVGAAVCSADSPSNSVAQSLMAEGVWLTSDVCVKLPEPVLVDGLAASAQEAVLRQVADRYPLEEFLRDSPVARFALRLQPLLDAQGRRNGQRLDLSFVAHGSLETVRSKSLLDQLISVGRASARGLDATSRPLSDQELAERELAVSPEHGVEESYVDFSAPILDRVQLRGVQHQVVSYGERSIVAAQRLDPRFAADATFPNQWRPLTRTPAGGFAAGDAQPYGGMGQYLKVTALVDADGKPDGKLFIEAHMVFHEPQGWFGGANLLGSKLPLAVQDNVREFRRLLRQSSR